MTGKDSRTDRLFSVTRVARCAAILFQTGLMAEYCAFIGCYVGSSGDFLSTFGTTHWSDLMGIFVFKDGIDRLSRNVGKKLPLLAE
jgi:hypothetical protein